MEDGLNVQYTTFDARGLTSKTKQTTFVEFFPWMAW